MLTLIVISCKKDKGLAPVNENNTVLSKNSPDYLKRLSAIKEKYYSFKFDQKLIANVNQKYSWIPDWEHPRSQIVNDTVSYVFFPLVTYVTENNKPKKISELRSANYLMVKNEKEFYKAFYYQSISPASKETSELAIDNFTGNLLLTNFENGKSYLLDYVDGKVSQGYQKKKMLALNKQSISKPGSISYWESICRTELKFCKFASDGPTNCNSGTVHIIYSPDCHWPQGNCGGNYSLIDSSEVTVCEDQWFPDPPTDPGDNGGGTGGGGDSGTTTEEFNHRINLDELSPCASSVLSSLMYQSQGSVVAMIQKFSGEVPGYTWNLKNGTLPDYVNGSTNKTTGGASTIIDIAKYKNGTDLALARTLLHEAVHAYLVSYFANNPALAQLSYPDMLVEWEKQKHPTLNDVQHIEMTIEFKNDIAAGLREYGDLHNYSFSSPEEKNQFYSDMAWGGLEQTPAYKSLSVSDQNRILDTIVAEQYGTDRTGTPQAGKGTPSGC